MSWYIFLRKTYFAEGRLFRTRGYTTTKACSNHSHKKLKDSLETRAEPTVFSVYFHFRKSIEPSPRKSA